jgi:chorismate-pyruvate lyase
VLIDDELERTGVWRRLTEAVGGQPPPHAPREAAPALAEDPDAVLGWLRRGYALFGLPEPDARPVDVQALPDRARRLLAHHQSMTRTLEAEYRRPMALRVLGSAARDGRVSRHVLLVQPSGVPVVMAMITIAVDQLVEEARRQVAEGRVPLGRVLAAHGVRYGSHPLAYFSLAPDDRTAELLGADASAPLYGRLVILADDDRRILAHGLEVLGPDAR